MRVIFVIFVISGCTLNFEINNESGMADNGASVSEGATQTGRPTTETKTQISDPMAISDVVPDAFYK